LDALTHWKPDVWRNSSYRPWFYRDVWPILFRADEMIFVTNVCSNRISRTIKRTEQFRSENLSLPPFVVRSAERKHQSESVLRITPANC